MEHEKETIPGSVWALTIGVVITIISIWVGQNNGLMPEQASEQAPLVDNFFNLMVIIGTALFLLVEGAIIFAAIKYRKPKGDNTDAAPIKGNLPLEVFWTAIPAIIVIILGIYSVDVYKEMGGLEIGHEAMMAHHHSETKIAMVPGSEMTAPLIDKTQGTEIASSKIGVGASPLREGKLADLVVNVTGLQFAWLFNYQDLGIMSGQLHVPVGKDVLLNITAKDVIHAFWVPQFRLKQDAIPGEETQLRFVATKPGNYPIVCAELCGSYHGGMRSEIIVHTPEEYDAWLEENQVASKQQDLKEAVAVKSSDRSNSEFLAPYAEEIGIDHNSLAQLQQ
ncbi:MAG: cytochrome c oxidase subunit II [Prochloraceae cyanobacterium]|nr:cytochrome c oxidase subunit II [Prochloraceae cyanobacterium]